MTDLGSLPPSVLLKIAQIEQRCIGLTTRLEADRRDLQRLRIEQRDLTPRTVYDEYGANRESERLIAEAQRLTAAITAQTETCERLEKQMRAEERVVTSCKRFLHELPAGARLRVIEAHGGDLDDVRARIKQVQDEIAQLQRLPVPSADLGERIKAYVERLAAKAQPVMQGIGDGQALRVLWPLTDHADRATLTGFVPDEGNALLLTAMLHPEHLAERLTQSAVEGSMPASERDQGLQALQHELTGLRYQEEASICAAISNGEEVSRTGSQPPWAVLMVQVEHELEAAA